jgi:hypothetical protein
MKNTISAAFLLSISFFSIESYAQGNSNATGSASQTVVLDLAPVIGLKFTSNNSTTGGLVSLSFNTAAQYQNGIVSNDQELSVSSNKAFKVSVQTDANSFAYSGAASSNPTMSVDNTLFLSVKNNQTGGNVNGFFDNSFHSLAQSSQDILTNGQQGGDKKLTVNYKAVPTLAYASGIYSVGVVYTATQP